MGTPFIGSDGTPRLVECAVLYFDLLGVSAMAQGEAAGRELERFDRVIRGSFPYPIGAAAAAGEATGAYPASVFSDSVVQAVPVPPDRSPAASVFQVVLEVAQLQLGLIAHRYFARGAIALDDFHSYDGLLFGPALVEAVALERDVALNPRIVLSPAATAALLRVESGSVAAGAYTGVPVLVDEDRIAFVDYLTGAFQADPELDLATSLITHRDVVAGLLEKHRANFGHWSKYRWAAEYHNATCVTYADLLFEREGGFESFLINSVHTRRKFRPLLPAGGSGPT